ncbi:hypothetical protein SDC9_195230 [bioreactor metagenome]|uniref:Uncharacterized protein n=1 Tax=bioreactor metagenome TaxID=1076179 RepID=A0A645I8F0_9ZZZZ
MYQNTEKSRTFTENAPGKRRRSEGMNQTKWGQSMLYERNNSARGDAKPLSLIVHALGGGRFDRDEIRGYVHRLSEARLHRLRMRLDLWALADDGCVRMRNAQTERLNAADHLAQQRDAVGAFVGGIRIGE